MIEWPGGLGEGLPQTPMRGLELRPAWQEEAACRGRWAVMAGPDEAAAKALCAGCPVLEECLEMALDTEDVAPVWAAMTREERLRTCPVCAGPKPRTWLACNFAHILQRTARLMELAEMGDPDVDVPIRQRPTARTSESCPLPRGWNHNTARAYRRGCRCDESREALRLERQGRGTHTIERGAYGPRRKEA